MVHNTLQTIQDRIQYLRENTDFMSAVFDSLIGYAIIAADFDGNIIACNEGAHKVYGYAPDEVIGKENIDIFFLEEFIKAGGMEQVASKLLNKRQFSPNVNSLRICLRNKSTNRYRDEIKANMNHNNLHWILDLM